jgi:replicative DNA helicase
VESIKISLESKDGVFEEDFKDAQILIDAITKDKEDSDELWLLEITEKWCQEKAIYNAIKESIIILDDKESKKQTKTKGAIPHILAEALGVSFDPNVGHDYLEDADTRFEFYHRKEVLIPFDLEYMNRITGGGLAPKTLSVILAGPNVGKSLSMCHIAAAALASGYNVLYITMEMAQERIASRIDANLLDLPLDTIKALPKENYDRRIAALKTKVKGKLIVKEYPTAAASVTHFRNLLNELKLKKQFKPALICVDYLNICCSSRLKMGSTVNSYTYVKAIAEELRGLAVEYNVPIVSATQTTRSGSTNSDPDMTDTSESFGLPATVDNLWAFINNDELEKMNKVMVKQLKNRDNDVTKNKRFLLGIDRTRMRLYDIDESEQNLISDDSKTPENVYKSVGQNMDKLKKAGIQFD